MALIAVGLNNSLIHAELFENIESIFDEFSDFQPRFSDVYVTPSFPAGSGPDYLNAAIAIDTHLSPKNLLNHLHEIENKFHRLRPYRWAPRSCDLDLLFFDGEICPSREEFDRFAQLTTEQAREITPTQLILPHPRLHERAFVLGPLLDIASDFLHPIYQKSVAQMWAELPLRDRLAICKI